MTQSQSQSQSQPKPQPQIEDIYPLSPSQQGILLNAIAAGADRASGIYLEISLYDLRGELDLAALRQAWQMVIQRHPALRTGFLWKNRPDPVQFVVKQVAGEVAYQDWRACAGEEQVARQQRYLQSLTTQGLPLGKPPLLQLTLFHLADQHYRLLCASHHILFDGWCLPLLFHDLLACYQAQRCGQPPRLPAAPPYRSYIQWLKRQDWTAAQRFWQSYLQGFRHATRLGIAPAVGEENATAAANGWAAPTYIAEESRYHDLYGELPAALTAALQAFARQQQITLNTVMQGVWALLLGRYSGESDILFGVTVAGRPSQLPGVEAIIGLFINTIPLRTTLDQTELFATWLARQPQQSRLVEEYAYCSAGQIQTWSELPGATPLFQSLLVFQNYAQPRGAVQPDGSGENALGQVGFTLTPVGGQGARTTYPLTMLISPLDQVGLHLIHDRTQLLDEEAAKILAHWQTLLQAIATNPAQPIGQLQALIPNDQIPQLAAPADQTPTKSAVGPRNPVEQTLVQIWEEILGIQPIGVEDNFFAIGGHSFLAVQLIAKVTEAFGQKFSLADLLQQPTLAAMAKTIAPSALHATAAGQATADQPLPFCLVPFQRSGPRAPLYLVHGADGQVLCYAELAKTLGNERPLYGLQALAMDRAQTPHTTVTAMAEHYVTAIRQVQPHGPYRLLGWSFGGYVVYEMAQLLQRLGEPVAHLILLDTAHPALLPRQWLRLDETTLLFSWMRPHINNQDDASLALIACDPELPAFRQLDSATQYQMVIAWSQQQGLLPATWRAADLRHLIANGRTAHQALQAYQPQPYAGHLTLIRVDSTAAQRDSTLGWQTLVSKGVTVHPMPGTHQQMVIHPYVTRLAAILRKEIDQIG
jgi:thioesterase domain-containing protein/acyl carrier protein